MLHEDDEEFQINELVCSELDALGTPYRHPFTGTVVVATVGTDGPPFVTLRANMEALHLDGRIKPHASLVLCRLVRIWPYHFYIAPRSFAGPIAAMCRYGRGGRGPSRVLTIVNINHKPSTYPAYILNSITKHRNRGLTNEFHELW